MKKNAVVLAIICVFFNAACFSQFADYSEISGVYPVGNNSMWGNGISTVDFNNDQFDDLTIGSDIGVSMYQSNGDGTFEMVQFLYINSHVMHILWIDYDNDDDLDLLVTTYGDGILLFESQSELVFLDKSFYFQSFSDMHAYGASWGDYDRDGWIDLFVCQYEYGVGYPDYPNLLFHNDAGQGFTEVGGNMGVNSWVNNSFQSVWTDFDNDGWVDLYVINDHDAGNEFYKNVNGQYFENLSFNGSGVHGSCMSNSIADYDKDGDFDIFISNSGPQFLLQNNQDHFEEVSVENNAYMYTFGWGGLWIDYNLDGWEDLYVCNDETWTPSNMNFFLVNQGGNGFEQYNFDPYEHKTYSIASGDFNGDLKPDMAIFNGFPASINVWINQNSDTIHAVKLKLQGQASNFHGVGAKVHTYFGGEYSLKQILCGENYISQNSNDLIFGIGEHEVIDSVVIEWPSGWKDHYYNLQADIEHTLIEGASFNVQITSSTNFKLCPFGSTVLTATSNDLAGLNLYAWSNQSDVYSAIYQDTGTHWLTATNSFGIQKTFFFHLNYYETPEVQSQTSPTICHNSSDGSCLIASNELIQVNGQFFNGSLVLENLQSGMHSIPVIDINGCQRQIDFIIETPEDIVLNIDSITLCSAPIEPPQLSMSGGTAPYSIEWENEGANLENGANLFIVNDANGCQKQMSLNLFIAPIPDITINKEVICTGQLSPFTFNAINQDIEITQSYTEPIDSNWLPSGNYNLVFTTEYGCTYSQPFQIDEFPTIDVSIIDTIINDQNSLYAQVHGGSPPFSFYWSNSQTEQYVSTENNQEFWTTVTDSNGCSDSDSFTATANIQPITTAYQIFPNPCDHQLTIQYPKSQDIQIFDSHGKLILATWVNPPYTNIDTTEWNSGLYIIKIENSFKSIVKN